MKIPSLVLLICLASLSVRAQTDPKTGDTETLKKAVLLADVRTLALEVPKLDGPLARALASAELADAAWTLERKWSEQLLREAYQLTYLSEEEQRQLGPEPPGTPPRPPTAISRARTEVRKRILSVARRDRVFADQLLHDSSARLTKDDRQMMYAQLTRMALEEGDNQTALNAIQENMAIDPTQSMLVELINDLAVKDRAMADNLILQYISGLSKVELVGGKLGRSRADLVLRWLIFPNSFFPDPNKKIPSPGPGVMRAYVRYVIESLSAQEQKEPGSLLRQRTILLAVWPPLNQYAPELREQFMQLEALSRTPGQDASLPTKSNEELDQERFRQKQKESLNETGASEQSIDAMISNEDFETARKLVAKLPEGERKKQLTEKIIMKEAMSLVRKGDLVSADNLAEQLTNINSILQVYPLLVQGYVTKKDQTRASAVAYQAMRKLKEIKVSPTPASKQFGMPAEFAPAASEVDGVLSALGRLAKALLPINSLLAAEIVDEIVVKANASQLDTTQGRTGIDSELFRGLAAKDEVRARAAGESFKDRLRRIVALAAIYQWKARELDKGRKEAHLTLH